MLANKKQVHLVLLFGRFEKKKSVFFVKTANLFKIKLSSLLKNMSISVKKSNNNSMFNPIFAGNFILLVLFLRGKKNEVILEGTSNSSSLFHHQIFLSLWIFTYWVIHRSSNKPNKQNLMAFSLQRHHTIAAACATFCRY